MSSRTTSRILIVEDEEVARIGLKRILDRQGCEIDFASDGAEGLEKILGDEKGYDVVLSDYKMPRLDGLELLRKLGQERPVIRVIMITGRGSVETAVEALKLGAYDFIQKPFDITLIRSTVDRALREKQLAEENLYLKKQLSEHFEVGDGVVWEDSKMKEILLLVQKIAPTTNPVLIEGDSGVGKELLARSMHRASRVRDRNFMALNCGAFAEDILVSELFGYEKGAFTGADSRKAGIFESLNGGTLFLDEIGDLPMSMQAKFLRVLQEKEFYRIGGRDLVKTEFRLIAATNKNLKTLVSEGRFREDLYYRIRVHYIQVPPLRERYADIAPLANFFVRKFRTVEGSPIRGISREAMAILQSYDWPGNVRELENVIREMMVTTEDEILTDDDVPGFVKDQLKGTGEVETLEEVKIQHIRHVLKLVNGNRTRAAKILGVPRISFQRLLLKYKELAEIK